ncbi:rhomboid family intramembrane serine protease [Alteromonas confluentis]|uniref:Rhomboid family intramembrane serine protease n=1 Tax=Alteromonas confluentis TaxID=1656094 RepID=A0A1E7Z5D6_9ALTE|nr:rhomboid family intramembrane serine protease [Alteromonas confluentis]OFC68745.1 rhomboid family intramembrane serine protease [Alteromonas confluentis]
MNRKLNRDALIQAIKLSTVFVALLWVIQSAGVLFHLPLRELGITPLSMAGLHGIVTAPLVHSSYEHLFHNTLPLLVLGTALIYGYPKTRMKVLLFAWLGSGIGVWLFGRPSMHLGASGVAHGLFFYLFVVAILRRDKRSVGLMMIAFFLYGGMMMSIFPRDPQISYEAHFFGALGGAIAAILFGKQDPKPVRKVYTWEVLEDDDPVIGDQWKAPVDHESRR